MIVQAVAERVALAMENARLFQQTQLNLAETSTLYQLSRQLNEAPTLEDLLQAIIVSVTPDAARGQVWIFELDKYEHPTSVARVHTNMLTNPRQLPRLVVGVQLDVGTAMLEGVMRETVYLVDHLETPPAPLRALSAFMQEASVASYVLMPLTTRGASKGFITIDFDTGRPFSERERRLFRALAAQASVAVDNRLLLRQTEQALSRNENLYAASRIISSSQRYEDLVYSIVMTASREGDNFSLALLEDETDRSGWPAFARIVARSQGIEVYEADELIPLNVEADSPMRQVPRPRVGQRLFVSISGC
ncbi:MAG: GAF domain-containing protein [Nitrospiraceae bacterium]|nr:GAF domain-containing protein [Nitrospiraceae bacterium]